MGNVHLKTEAKGFQLFKFWEVGSSEVPNHRTTEEPTLNGMLAYYLVPGTEGKEAQMGLTDNLSNQTLKNSRSEASTTSLGCPSDW